MLSNDEKSAVVYAMRDKRFCEFKVSELHRMDERDAHCYAERFIAYIRDEYDRNGNDLYALENQRVYDSSTAPVLNDGICNSRIPLFDNYLENTQILTFYEVHLASTFDSVG